MKKLSFIKSYIFQAIIISTFLLSFLPSCNSDYTPKPRAYFRIALPEKHYTVLDSTLPYIFEYPTYAHITNDPLSPQETTWINLEMPVFKGRIHISYKPLTDKKSLNEYAEDSRTLAFKHISKASGIEQIAISDPNRKVYGLVYEIKGMGAASPYQFYLTDSTKNFIRGSLYFDVSPNNDSLAPVITFVQKDIQHIIETLKWK